MEQSLGRNNIVGTTVKKPERKTWLRPTVFSRKKLSASIQKIILPLRTLGLSKNMMGWNVQLNVSINFDTMTTGFKIYWRAPHCKEDEVLP
jgi:hypothetical protein